MKDDTDEIIRRLEADPEAILKRYWPSYIRVGSKALLTPKIKEKQKKPTSSFVLNLAGKHKNQWYRFSAGIGGGLIALIYYSELASVPSSKADWSQAFKLARQFLGMEQQRELSDEERQARDQRREQEQAAREERRREDEKVAAEARAERTLSAKQVWQETIPLAGSQGEAYLVFRGLPPLAEWPWDCSAIFRFHPSLSSELEPRAGRFPTIIAKVQDPFGNAVGVWQVFLDPNGLGKAPLENAKVGRGPVSGGAVRIGGDAEKIGLAEGFETSLGFWFLENLRKPIWASLSTSGMRGFEPPIFVKHVSIYQDCDKGLLQGKQEDENIARGKLIVDPPGSSAAVALHTKLIPTGVGSNINPMPLILGDGLDLWNTRRKYEEAI